MSLDIGDVISLSLSFRASPRFYRLTELHDVDGVSAARLDGPYFDLECTQRDYNDASTAPKFHPSVIRDSFALKDDPKDAT